MTLVMKKFTTRLSWKPKPNRKPRFFLQNLPKPTDRKHFETVTTLAFTYWYLLQQVALPQWHLSQLHQARKMPLLSQTSAFLAEKMRSSKPPCANGPLKSCSWKTEPSFLRARTCKCQSFENWEPRLTNRQGMLLNKWHQPDGNKTIYPRQWPFWSFLVITWHQWPQQMISSLWLLTSI